MKNDGGACAAPVNRREVIVLIGSIETHGLGFRLLQWALRAPTLPAPEYYPNDDPDPEHIAVFTVMGHEIRQGKQKPESIGKLRVPTLGEALTGISGT